MTEIFREIDEALTQDRLKAWWRRYRIVLLATLFITLSLGSGWQFWQQGQNKRLLKSGEMFFELLAKTKPATKPATSAQNLAANSVEGDELLAGYKILWAFKRAQLLGEQQEWQAAHDILEEIVAERSNDKLYRNYAQLWQAANSIKQGMLEDALKLLSPLTLARGNEVDPSLQAFALYLKASVVLAQEGTVGGKVGGKVDGKVAEASKDLEKALSLGKIATELRAKIEQAQNAISTHGSTHGSASADSEEQQ